MSPRSFFPTEASIICNQALNATLCSNYCFGDNVISCHLFRRGMHDTYVVRDDVKKYYLKIYYHGLRTMEEIESEVVIVKHLKKDGINVGEPVMMNNGSYIFELNAIEGNRFCVLYNEVLGNEGITGDLMTETLGSFIASMHNSFDKIITPLNRWHLDSSTFIDTSMSNLMKYSSIYSFDYTFLHEISNEIKQRIDNSFKKCLPTYGLCHGDIYSANVRFDSHLNPAIFDFDLCGYGWRAYDISLFLSAFGSGVDAKAMEERERRKEVFLNGYLRTRGLSDLEINSIYLFAPFRRIFNIGSLYARFAESWGHDIFVHNVNDEISMLKDWVKVYKI
ncbi:phosphotransferase enzyme family protein [Paenibacillus eucommiae]|uniref:Ser/Thr protein kinase RdoA (MazF antagonist) n=1 Tax=Paenibacillus eucommiae TaxID=1355755 RepID=A0ABS4IPX8_9BACL|nr:phosphotransferase [Paenibacillus eucommiae]MBP1989632.1 Ser/Thr protein kinase RdoA (MazF antagonist) [Paenibacillus eucommiae]